MKKLLIVESPAKAKTISQYLGSDYIVRASYGHVRDLPKSKLGVDVDDDFKPSYVVSAKSKKIVAELKKLSESADEVLLATDYDREGEAIAWHISHLIKSKKPMRRITFHEVTKPAIHEAVNQPREIILTLVDAQQARRVLDRLVGYKLSPLLWKKVYRGLSAGRVQSVAVRLIVEREKEIRAFETRQYFTVEAEAIKDGYKFTATLCDDKNLSPLEISKAEEAEKIAKEIKADKITVKTLDRSTSSLKTPYPFITSTLQQAAARELNFSVKKTMMVAQNLYEGIDIAGSGTVALITYMRTDSYQVSPIAKQAIDKLVGSLYGQQYLPSGEVVAPKKVRGAQEAHEAIRPTDVSIKPSDIKDKVSRDHYRLYDLIWRQAVASRMKPAEVETTIAKLISSKGRYLVSRGKKLIFDGHLKVLKDENDYKPLPDISQNEEIVIKQVERIEHFTQPPARYSEASLVRELERRGIGRPSTYAPIIQTIIERGYVVKENQRLLPQPVAEVVNDLLVNNFKQIVDYDFTAYIEKELDDIAEGGKTYKDVLKEFYEPFAKNLEDKEKNLERSEIVTQETDEKCPKCGDNLNKQLGRFGEYLKCPNEKCGYTAPVIDSKQFNEDQQKQIDNELSHKCEKCGSELTLKKGRFGIFISCSKYPDCKFTKPILIKASVKCPECSGDLVRKPTRRGKFFWGCSNYPKCQTAFWDEPIDDKCETCGGLLTKKNGQIICPVCKK